MKKTRRSKRGISSQGAAAPAELEPLPEPAISATALSLHELFQQQTRQMLDRADLSEEQKQNILIAMSCPCCGAGAMSYTAKLKR